MSAGFGRRPWQVAGLAAVAAAALAGCGASSSSTPSASGATTPASGATASATSSASALSAVQLAAKTAASANTVTGTMSVQAAVKAGATATATAAPSGTATPTNLALTATFAEQLRPSLLASIDITSLSTGGGSLPGGMSEVLTPSTLYLKSSALTQELHLTKPWIAIPLSQISKSSGIDLSQILNSVNGNGPLTESQLLAGATSVHQGGTSTLNGVPVTEYTGTLSLDKGMAGLPASTRTQLEQVNASEGLTTADFTVWIDNSHIVRKAVITEAGKALKETVTTTVTSLGQPVNITPPAATQTSPLPAGATS